MDWHFWLRQFPPWAARLDAMGLHRDCGETCWFACFWDLLFTASRALAAAVDRHVAAHRPFVAYQARLGGLWNDVKVMDGRAVALLQTMVALLMGNASVCGGAACGVFVTSDNEGPKAEMRRVYGDRSALPGPAMPPPPPEGCIGRGGEVTPPPPGRPADALPLSPWRHVPASMAFVTDSNRPPTALVPSSNRPPTRLRGRL